MQDSRQIQELMQKGLKELQTMKVWNLYGSAGGYREESCQITAGLIARIMGGLGARFKAHGTWANGRTEANSCEPVLSVG